MSVSEYLSKLLPSFENSNLRDSLRKTNEKINLHLLPQYRNLREVCEHGFKDELVKELNTDICRHLDSMNVSLKAVRKPDVIDYIIGAMENTAPTIAYLEERLKTDVPRTLMVDGITFNKKTLLQLIDSMLYFANYASDLLNFITHQELMSVDESNIKTAKLPPDMFNQLKVTSHTFSVTVRVASISLTDLRGIYGEIPDMVVDEDTLGELAAVFGPKLNPLGFDQVPFPISLVFYARLSVADKQMDNLEEVIQTAKTVEYRIAAYKRRIAAGEGDAAIEKVLDMQEKRLSDLLYERDRLEKKYGLK